MKLAKSVNILFMRKRTILTSEIEHQPCHWLENPKNRANVRFLALFAYPSCQSIGRNLVKLVQSGQFGKFGVLPMPDSN
jgi:hypothetical protein